MTHHNVVGTKFDGTGTVKLNITATKDGVDYTQLTSSQLSIDYPKNITSTDKVKINGTDVEIAKDAPEGVYKVVLSIKEGQQVKVAEYLFTVKDFNFDINPKVVYNNGSATTITCSQPASADNVYTSGLGTVNGNKVEVNGSTTVSNEGTYTITYTVWNSTAQTDPATATYTKTFEVRNTHSVKLSKTSVDRNKGTNASVESDSDDTITVTTFQNGSATTTTQVMSLSVVATKDATSPETGFTFEYSTDNSHTLKVKNNVTPGTYYVKYVSKVANEDKAEYAQFTVVE